MEILNIDTKIMSEYFCQSVIIPPLQPLDNFILITGTKIKAAEELKKRTSRVIDHFPELRSGRSSLVVIDGEMKSLTSEFIEQVDENTKLLGVLILVMDLQDGILIQEQSIRSLDLSELDLEMEKEKKEADEEEREESVESEIKEESQAEAVDEKKKDVQKKPKVTIANENTFDKFLDIMEVF